LFIRQETRLLYYLVELEFVLLSIFSLFCELGEELFKGHMVLIILKLLRRRHLLLEVALGFVDVLLVDLESAVQL
jgi:hypothetical protein